MAAFVQRMPVGLRARGARGALAAVEVRNWMPPFVRGQRHGTAQRIHLFHQMVLPMPPMLGLQLICPRVSMLWVSSRFAAHAGSGQGGLGACMATADNDHIKFLGVQHGGLRGLQGQSTNTRARFALQAGAGAEGLGSPSGAIAGNP